MVERLTSALSLQRRMAWSFAFAGYAIAALLVAVQVLLRSLLFLLHDVFVGLGLPFAMLFGMAGWHEQNKALGSVTTGFVAGDHAFWAIFPLVAAAIGGLLFAAFNREKARWGFGASGLSSIAASLLGGWVIGLFMLPGLIFCSVGALRRSTSD